MMARLLDDVAPVSGGNSVPTAVDGDAGAVECKQPARKLSFKTRQAAARSNYRTAKVSLSSTNVALLASKFNTIVIEDGVQGRALLRKLSTNQRKPSVNKETKRPVKVKAEGMVKAAIEIFEHQEELSSKSMPRKGNDSRPKLVVVRKTSKHSTKQEEHPKPTVFRESAVVEEAKERKDLKIEAVANTTERKEVRRKPSLKAKPVLRDSVTNRRPSKSLNQRIARFNSTEDVANNPNETVQNKEARKPKFDMNERIAQFSRTESSKSITTGDKSILKRKESNEDTRKSVTFEVDEKENKQEVTKSLLRNSLNKQASLVEQTKNRLASIIQQNNDTNQQTRPKSIIRCVNKEVINKYKSILEENKDQQVFQSMPDIVRSVEGKDEGNNKKLSFPKDATILENVFVNNNINVNSVRDCSDNICEFSAKANVTLSPDHSDCLTIIQTGKDTTDSETIQSSPSKNLKASMIPITSESPKLEKKSLCVATDPVESIQLDKIKPNSSFLWKPSTKISVITEVPIYDDRPEMNYDDNVFDDDCSKYNTNNEEKSVSENEGKNTNSLELDIASSFILEMTEQIDRRFSSGSTQENELHETDNQQSINEVNTNLMKNTSFLHGSSNNREYITSNKPKQKPLPLIPYVNHNQFSSRTSNTLPLPPKNLSIDSPPQLPEKKPKTSIDGIDSNAPAIPPPHTKPTVTRTPSQEAWLSKCKQILEIPPPLRSREGSREELISSSQSLTVSISEQQRSLGDKRFSVSQIELQRRISEMNLSNKRNSLPSSRFIPTSYTVSEDHYSSIQNLKNDVEDQGAYESIGENNYAEIEETETLVVRREEVDSASNIYDDVGEVEMEDHYEAINCPLVAAQDSDSSCDQSNSLYGLTRPASQGGGYQAGVAGGSDTSDEWIDLDNSDEQQESVFIFREKERRGAETWSMKVRKQWSRQTADGDDGSDESVPRSYENIEPHDETAYCDDFDDSFSDSSFDQETITPSVQVEEKKAAPLSEGIYGLMKQAGQRMRKHWPLGKSLTRMGKTKSTSSVQSVANLGRRGWSFKSRDKPSTAQSTFYLNSNTLTRTDSKSETKVDPRRLSTASMLARPTSPPPPPPRNSVDESSRRKSALNSSNSSGDNEGYIGQQRLSRNGHGNSMWYIETSTDTASEHGSSQGSDLNLRFADEPLYQFYAENIAKMTMSELSDRDSEGYEEITPGDLSNSVPSALDLVSSCQHRSLWCEVPLVRYSGVLDTLSQSRKRLQEAKFEVMTSEASYFKSLTVLDKLFASCPLFCDENILTRDDKITLFGNVGIVRKCSEKLLLALHSCWQECILLTGISDVVYDHIKSERQVYIKYCTNQISMDRTLKRLKQNNSNFSTVLAQLESEPQCQSLTLYSFLMLPMQRITRLRLLYETILTLVEPSDSEYTSVQRTLEVLNKCVSECNEGARSQERHEEMVKLSKQLDFPPEMAVPILEPGSDRWLVRSGPMVQINLDAKQTFSRRLSRSGPKLTFFLFTDLLLVTKKKSEESYQVLDHCQRSLVETREIRDFPGYSRSLLGLTLLENAEKKTVDMTVSCESEPEHQRWLQVLQPPQSDQPGETLYEGWDCPQVTVVHAYTPQQPDELPLSLGDVVNVLRKTEGWFYGERTRDGEKGWFPGNYSREIASKHVRARNLKQRHRLLQLTADFVQQQRRVKS
ncbi:uncharacterized protein LOC129002133 isoform X2 [Macrosteles quadrilineatus]|uniref:uncharacterized protein LOC129002133 isoform X2 n=1 Tax=Macrosteles quadrilineatus TaxID=74068 RepID=UPI0023E23131|nr:uncharacterized protein LOC129002133 isoform X2 [Macrosteles quadrilineatus]